MIAIITKEKKYQSQNHGMIHFMREMINWNEDINEKEYTSIISEYGVKFNEVDVIDEENTTYEENSGEIVGDPVYKSLRVLEKVETRRTKAFKVSYKQSEYLFKQIGKDILSTDNLPEKHNEMKALALLIDTNSYLAANDGSFFGLNPGDFEVYNP